MQTTLSNQVEFRGVGLHSGAPAKLVMHPAPADFGIWFKRADVGGGDPMIAARREAVVSAELCTRLANDSGIGISTVEHVMAALAGCGVHNALVEVDGPEVPILDGSSRPFVEAILGAGLSRLDASVRAIRVLKPVEARSGAALARLLPADGGLSMRFEIDFEEAAIGRQEKTLSLANGNFVHELADSRTFCSAADVAGMRERGLALGGTLENAVVVDGADVLNPGGLRHEDEAVRHKMLDALGDLALAGGPIIGRYEGYRAGHTLTHSLLQELFDDPDAYAVVTCDDREASVLPGAGLGDGVDSRSA